MLSALAGIALQVAAAARPVFTLTPADSGRSSDELRVASQRVAPAVRSCYEREGLRLDPGLSGTIDVSVTIVPQGSVRDVKVDTLEVRGIGMREVASCVTQLFSRWHFSSGTYGLEETTFTFRLAPIASDTLRRLSSPSP